MSKRSRGEDEGRRLRQRLVAAVAAAVAAAVVAAVAAASLTYRNSQGWD